MYVLIADSGSTKTDWSLIEGPTVILQLQTKGFNPYFQTRDEISLEMRLNLKPHIEQYLSSISEVHFYGAGCSTAENCKLMTEAISMTLYIKNIHVSHDLLAAARALCKRERGIAAILGTGSNSCLYDGKDIIENVPSTGYLWSDYGGGSQIGKFFIREYFEDNLPANLREAFEKAGYSREVILQNVYKLSLPSRYLATVSLFVCKHLDHPKVAEVLESCFDSFFVQQISKYTEAKKYRINTIGSIGYYYRDFIARVAAKHGFKMGKVVKSPMEGLIEFHSQS